MSKKTPWVGELRFTKDECVISAVADEKYLRFSYSQEGVHRVRLELAQDLVPAASKDEVPKYLALAMQAMQGLFAPPPLAANEVMPVELMVEILDRYVEAMVTSSAYGNDPEKAARAFAETVGAENVARLRELVDFDAVLDVMAPIHKKRGVTIEAAVLIVEQAKIVWDELEKLVASTQAS